MKDKSNNDIKRSPIAISKSTNGAILLAGGSGSRMRGAVKDKVLQELMGMPVILHSFAAFVKSAAVGVVVFVCRDDAQQRSISAKIKKFFPRLKYPQIKFARGGVERQDSVLNGLKMLEDKSALAFIHDGARPLVGAENIVRLNDAAQKTGAAVLANRVSDTIKRVPSAKASNNPCRLADLDRKRLWAMQTPQVFTVKLIEDAYTWIKQNSVAVTDDVAAVTLQKAKVAIVENFSPNPKITVPHDIALVEFLAKFSVNNK